MLTWSKSNGTCKSNRYLLFSTHPLLNCALPPLLCPQGPRSENLFESEEGENNKPARHYRVHDEFGERRNDNDEEEREKDGPGNRPRLEASPPTGRKRLHGARPYAGRSQIQHDDTRRRETKAEEGARSPMALPIERNARKRCIESSIAAGKSKIDSPPKRGIRDSHVSDRVSERDEVSGRETDRRCEAGRKEGTRRQEEDSDSDAVVSEMSSVDAERCAVLRAREGNRSRRKSKRQSVRAIAESFVGGVLDDVSSADSLSRMSLSLK